jgi:chemotaxis protein MotA
MTKAADAENEYFHVLHVCLSAFNKGMSPILATEMGRRTIPRHFRPSFGDMEKTCRNRGAAAPEAPAAAKAS